MIYYVHTYVYAMILMGYFLPPFPLKESSWLDLCVFPIQVIRNWHTLSFIKISNLLTWRHSVTVKVFIFPIKRSRLTGVNRTLKLWTGPYSFSEALNFDLASEPPCVVNRMISAPTGCTPYCPSQILVLDHKNLNADQRLWSLIKLPSVHCLKFRVIIIPLLFKWD